MTLKELVTNKTIAIVGNSGIEMGKGRGKEIDSRDVVIRMTNYSLADHFRKDYGARTDIWVTSFHHDIVLRPNTFKRVCCPFPINDAKHAAVYRACRPEMVIKYSAECPPVPHFEILLTLILKPSTGLAFLWWLHSIRGIQGTDLFGFDHFSGKIKHHYFDEDTSCSHNRVNEKRIVYERILRKD